MGAGSPPAQTTTTSKSEQRLPLYAIPYGRELLSRGVAESRRPYTPYLGQRIAGKNSLMDLGIRGVGESVGANRGLFDLGRSSIADILNQTDPIYGQLRSVSAGDYLSPDSNPYLKDTYNTAAQAVTDQYQNAIAPQLAAEAAQAGAFGGSAYSENRFRNQYDLGRNLNELSTGIYGGAYESERDRQLAAQQMLGQMEATRAGVATAIPGFAAGEQDLYNNAYQLGSLERDISQQYLDLNYANFLEQINYPLSRLDILGSILAQSTGRGGTSTSSVTGPGFQPRYSPWAGAAGGALAGYGASNNYWGAGLGALLGGLGGY